MGQALVLNASFEPLGVLSDRRALVLVLASKAMPLEESGRWVHSEHLSLALPLVIRLTRYVRLPYRGHVPLTRRALFVRDGGRCVYCEASATSVDHVVPRSRGGDHTWENVVAACARCNRVKADRMLAELGWRLRVTPHQPTGTAWRVLASGRADPRWQPYLLSHGTHTGLAAESA